MADVAVDKKLKLANTKKRFKELQELKKKRNDPNLAISDSAQSSNRNTPVEQSPGREVDSNENRNKVAQEMFNVNQEVPAALYFNPREESKLSHFFKHDPENSKQFFDNISETSEKVGNSDSPSLLTYFNTSPVDKPEVDNIGLPKYFDNISSNGTVAMDNTVLDNQELGQSDHKNDYKLFPDRAETPEQSSNELNEDVKSISDKDSIALDYPEIKQNEMYVHRKHPEGVEFQSLPQSNYSDNISDSVFSQVGNEKLLKYLDKPEVDNIGLPKYFDNISSNGTVAMDNTVLDNQELGQSDHKNDYKLFPDRAETPEQSSNELNEDVKSISDKDSIALDYPEIKQNEMYVHRKHPEGVEFQSLPQSNYSDNISDSVFSQVGNEKLLKYLGTSGTPEEEKCNISDINREIDSSTDLTKKEIQHSNAESLRQLSDQFAQMIEPNYEYSSSEVIVNLEKRNRELAASLDQEKLTTQQLRDINVELQATITQLQNELAKQEIESNFKNIQETNQLKNELQTQLQTIGLLVDEKSELSSNLSQYELICKQKTSESEELQARLKASRSRVADLERELGNLKSEKTKFEGLEEQFTVTLNNLREECRVLREQKDELAQDLLEVREKLKNILDDNGRLQQENKDVASKLSLAEIKIQQLSSGGALGISNQIEQLTQEKLALQTELDSLNQMLKSTVKERDESNVQFQQYAQQLNAQINNLSSKLEQIQQEKENLVIQEQNRIKHIGELERQLQNFQSDQVTYATRNSRNIDLRGDLEKSKEMCIKLQIEKTTIEENYTKVSNEKDLLLKELEAKTDSISQLESIIEQLRGNQPDSVKLLATMESDKVAASRAIQQNNELKQQLESMQEVFMKMDNDKVVLTENLKAQQQTNKELVEKLQKTELSLQSLADAIDIKDKELTHLRDESEELNRQILQHEQREDRLRHYEAHDNTSHILKHELQEARHTINKLTNDLTKKTRENSNSDDLEDAKRTILELTNEINKLKMSQLKEETSKDGFIEIQEKNLTNPKEDYAKENENILDKENAMKYLEEKVKRTMQEIADLTDEKQRLEHIVLQLQGETETIGEYVALYQHQRMILKQKALEKDQQLTQLANDREQIKIKLDRLNELIKKLVLDKGTVPVELLQHQESMNSQVGNLCETHSKINEEINKVAQSNEIEPPTNEGGDTKVANETAEEIINLLSEIKTSNLVQPSDNFHHCPWCSGQLMTV